MDVPRRIVHRAKMIPDIACKISKVVIPGAMIEQTGFSLSEGHHGVRINGEPGELLIYLFYLAAQDSHLRARHGPS